MTPSCSQCCRDNSSTYKSTKMGVEMSLFRSRLEPQTGLIRLEAADGRDYMCELPVISRDIVGHAAQHATGHTDQIPGFAVELGYDSKSRQPLWSCLLYKIAAFIVLIECTKALNRCQKEVRTDNKSANQMMPTVKLDYTLF